MSPCALPESNRTFPCRVLTSLFRHQVLGLFAAATRAECRDEGPYTLRCSTLRDFNPYDRLHACQPESFMVHHDCRLDAGLVASCRLKVRQQPPHLPIRMRDAPRLEAPVPKDGRPLMLFPAHREFVGQGRQYHKTMLFASLFITSPEASAVSD